ncbi:MAG TPA: hypothetical protein VKS60_22155 [Stellaceae bacterium]|nr:hypothetical protein [Stellaceae bacterium]
MTVRSTATVGVETWATIDRAMFLTPDEAKVEIAHAESYSDAGPRVDFWIAERVATDRRKVPHRSWADSRDCEPFVQVLKRFGGMEPMKPKPPIITGPVSQTAVVAAETGIYTLDVEGRYSSVPAFGHLHYETSSGTPLASWIDEALEALEPCWKAVPPAVESR